MDVAMYFIGWISYSMPISLGVDIILIIFLLVKNIFIEIGEHPTVARADIHSHINSIQFNSIFLI